MVEKMNVNDVSAVVDNEGLGYAVLDYMSSDSIADPELARLWDKGREAMREIEQYLEDHSTPDESETCQEASDLVTVRHESILCEAPPDIFAGVEERDRFGLPLVQGSKGGNLRMTFEGGRFRSDPEVFINGEFSRKELRDFLEGMRPAAATHVSQSVEIFDVDGDGVERFRYPRIA